MSSRIDWRNYDYSEGPPKISSNQRDTNPYSKAFPLKPRSATSSPVHHYNDHGNGSGNAFDNNDSENAIDHFQMNNSQSIAADVAANAAVAIALRERTRETENSNDYSTSMNMKNSSLNTSGSMRKNGSPKRRVNAKVSSGSVSLSPKRRSRTRRSASYNTTSASPGRHSTVNSSYVYEEQKSLNMPGRDNNADGKSRSLSTTMPSQKLSYRPASSVPQNKEPKAKAVHIHRSLATSSYTQLTVGVSSSARLEEDDIENMENDLNMVNDPCKDMNVSAKSKAKAKAKANVNAPLDMDADMQMQMEPKYTHTSRFSGALDRSTDEPFDEREEQSYTANSTTSMTMPITATMRELKRDRMTPSQIHSLDNNYGASKPRPVTPKDEEDGDYYNGHDESNSISNVRNVTDNEVVSVSSTRRNEDFNEVWNEAEEEWEQANETVNNTPIPLQRIISDEEEDEAQEKYRQETDDTKNIEDYEFESFAGDRSTNTARTGKSEASVGKMDVPRTVAPVSILRNGNRSPRRKHPWDKDYVDGEDGHENGPITTDELMNKEETLYDDQTNLKRYEAGSNANMAEDDLQQDLIHNGKAEKHENEANSAQHIAPHDGPESTDNQIPASPKDERKERRRRLRRRDDEDRVDDDDSIEDGIGNAKTRADTLQDRTKMAWSKRNQITATTMAPLAPAHGNSVAARKPNEKRLVSFQPQTSVHEFLKESNEDRSGDDSSSSSGSESDDKTEGTEYTEEGTYCSEDDTYDDDTYAGRSMHSVYTKSNESEVEDLLKDIFLVGSGKSTDPGRRELKYRKGNKERLKQEKLEREAKREDKEKKNNDQYSTEDDGTLDSAKIFEQKKANDTEKGSQKNNVACNDTDDEESRMDSTISRGTTYTEEEFDPFAVTYNYCEDLMLSLGNACGLVQKPKKVEERESQEISTLESWENSLVDFIFRTDHDNKEDEARNIENREALLQLAINAAKVKHSLEEVEYDEMHDLNVQSDVKFLFLSIGLPVGIVFSESPAGCWIKRIFENGNAATSFRGDKLEVGDQLASINGASALNKTVPEICRILADAPNSNDIELSFVRYIGPLRVASNEQQGYEVIDPRLSEERGKFSPNRKQMDGFANRSSSPTAIIRVKPKKSERQRSRSPTRLPATPEKSSVTCIDRVKSLSKSPTKTPDTVARSPNDASSTHSSGKKKKKKKMFGLFRVGKKKSK